MASTLPSSQGQQCCFDLYFWIVDIKKEAVIHENNISVSGFDTLPSSYFNPKESCLILVTYYEISYVNVGKNIKITPTHPNFPMVYSTFPTFQ